MAEKEAYDSPAIFKVVNVDLTSSLQKVHDRKHDKVRSSRDINEMLITLFKPYTTVLKQGHERHDLGEDDLYDKETNQM